MKISRIQYSDRTLAVFAVAAPKIDSLQLCREWPFTTFEAHEVIALAACFLNNLPRGK